MPGLNAVSYLVFGVYGEIALNLDIIAGITSSILSISESSLYLLRLNLTEPWAAVKGTPIDLKTCDGCKEPEVQADPDDAHMPCWSSSSRMDSPSIYSKLILVVFGSLLTVSPLTKV